MPGKKWAKEEENYLKENFEEKTCEEIAIVIGKTTKAVQHKFSILGLKRHRPDIGEKINRLTIKEKYIKPHYNQMATFVLAECECGNKKEYLLKAITSGRTKSCGCYQSDLQRERAIERNYKHGKSDLANNRLYRIWCGMKARCYIKSARQYNDYGGRGITVCDEWRYDFKTFESWALSNGYTDNLTIDRKKVNEGYYPENCSWKTITDQAKNKRDSVHITAWGETKILSDWSKDPRCKIDMRMIKYRIDNGWSPENAISIPPLKKGRCFGEPK